MEIDLKKMDFNKMKSNKNPNGEINTNRAKGIDGINNDARHNPAPSFVPPAISTPAPNSNQPPVSLKKPTELLSEAWELYKARWKTLLGIVVAPMLLTFFIMIIFFIGLGVLGIMEESSLASSLSENIIVLFIFSILFFIFFALVFIIQIWSQVAFIHAIKENKDMGIKKAYQESKGKIKSFFWVSLLTGFIIMGGFIFFAIPGFIFAVWFSFATFIVIAEDLKGMNAILKSREYVRNYWWSVLWRFLFMYIVLIGVMIVASIILILIPFLVNLVFLVLTPLMMVYMFLIYKNLKEIKGNFEFQPSAKARKSFVAIGVLGILTMPLLFGSIMLVSLNSARDKAMDAAHFAEISRLQIDLTIYYDEEGEYPESLSELGTGFINPETKEPYEYNQMDDGEDYEICVELKENERECFSSENSASDFYRNESDLLRNDTNKEEYKKEVFENTVKGRDKQRVLDLYSISKMLKQYKAENGIYPVSRTAISLNKDSSVAGKIQSVASDKSIPVDPNDPKYYYSYESSNGKSFELTARLEDIDDSGCDVEIKDKSGICIYKLQD